MVRSNVSFFMNSLDYLQLQGHVANPPSPGTVHILGDGLLSATLLHITVTKDTNFLAETSEPVGGTAGGVGLPPSARGKGMVCGVVFLLITEILLKNLKLTCKFRNSCMHWRQFILSNEPVKIRFFGMTSMCSFRLIETKNGFCSLFGHAQKPRT